MQEETVRYSAGGGSYAGRLFSDQSVAGPRPLVLLFPDWDGVTEYELWRAKQLAHWGYLAFVVDMYGTGVPVGEALPIEDRIELVSAFGEDKAAVAALLQAAFDAAVAAAGDLLEPGQVAAIGYCFGGSAVLEIARNEFIDVKGVGAFHAGSMAPVFGTALPNGTSTLIGLFQGVSDPAVAFPEDYLALWEELQAAGAAFQTNLYGLTSHAFTDPSNPKLLAYQGDGSLFFPLADERSWESLYHFLKAAFQPAVADYVTEPWWESGVDRSRLATRFVDYQDGEVALRGYLAQSTAVEAPQPAVLILPDWTGADQYEFWRAELLAEQGYIAMVADIYGAAIEQPVPSIPRRIELYT